MRDFLLNSEELLDRGAAAFIKSGEAGELLPCYCVRFNDRIKLAYYPDGCQPLEKKVEGISLDDACAVAQKVLAEVSHLETYEEISMENIVWDMDSIYLDEENHVYFICIPAVIPAETERSQIYVRRVYGLVEDLVGSREGSEEVKRQIDYQKEQSFGDWNALSEALEKRAPEEDERIVLRSINTPEPLTFRIGHEIFRIGSDEENADGVIKGVATVSPVHAEIGWNDINFYVKDLDSVNGTFVNDQRIAPQSEVPIGTGTVLRIADCTFSVE